jgi:hypothetical protein
MFFGSILGISVGIGAIIMVVFVIGARRLYPPFACFIKNIDRTTLTAINFVDDVVG